MLLFYKVIDNIIVNDLLCDSLVIINSLFSFSFQLLECWINGRDRCDIRSLFEFCSIFKVSTSSSSS